ncbi:MAG TPA: nucleoside-diphosphate-sugar epimerase, partial [Polyangiales bacterium]
RDFVSVHDVAHACHLALESERADYAVLNIGSGFSYTVREIAERLATVIGCEHIEPELTGRYRVGDIRHCFADISLAREVIDYVPSVRLESGLQELSQWLENQDATDHVSQAHAELASRGLTL